MAERKKNGQFVQGHTHIGPSPEVRQARLKLKALINELLIDSFEDFKGAMNGLVKSSPKAYCQIYVDLMAYSLPKISTIAFGADDDTGENPATVLLKEIGSYKKKQ